MINTSIPAATHAAFIVTALFAVATPAFSQAPTDAQRSAIRSECRSDYEAHCASVPPGGAASLQCLQKNMSSLSSSCQTAVRAVEAPTEPKAEAKPEPKAESKTESKTEAKPQDKLEDKPDAKPESAPPASSAAAAEEPA